MQNEASESRRGRAWNEVEDEQLVVGVVEGLDLVQLAERHGRTPAAIRARVDLSVPLDGVLVDDPLRWLRARLAREPSYPWRSVAAARRHQDQLARRSVSGSRDLPAEGLAGRAADVLAEWEGVTGHALRPERREVFLARQVVWDLAAADEAGRRAAARRLWDKAGTLLLDDWLLECVCPGATHVTSDWSLIDARDPDVVLVLRELVAAAVGELPEPRDRDVLGHRLGLHDQTAHTLEATAEVIGVSRERVRQLQTRAIRRLVRNPAPASGRLREVLGRLSCVDRDGRGAEPPAAERLLDLSEVLLPLVIPRQAIPLLARLAGADKVRAENLAAEASTTRALRHEEARREAVRQGRIERSTRRWAALATEVDWFGDPRPAPPQAELETFREEENLARGRFGTWHCPKLDRAVSYESETELQVIQLLSFASQVTYYQEQPLAISYVYEGRQRTYYPDLLAATADGGCILIEVKPVYEMAMAINAAKYRAAAEFCRRRGWGLVATDGYRTRRLLEHREVDPRLDAALSLALAAGQELSWPQVRAATGVLPLGSLDLAALILRREWEWRSRPFRLRASPSADPLEPRLTSAVVAPERHRPAALVETGPQPVVLPSPEDIEAARSPAGGWSRKQLADWGVPWPPPKGWKERLITRWKAQ
ncbi:TnsA endonuclease N-terminal domain-containing protein [Streptomyces sp. NPDC058534]|uniref:TnsA endonuclease N-terminal domain-containing protein n=1 Tax=Streptomyces sp. NPDC058534 TaxID=3346541 RepID=UPI00365F6CE8